MARSADTVILDAARYLEVVGVGETLSPDDVDAGLRRLNDYLSGLNARGGYYAGGELASGSAVALPDELLGFLTKALAMEMASDFGVQMGRREVDARAADRAIINATFKTPVVQPEGLMRNMLTTNYGRV